MITSGSPEDAFPATALLQLCSSLALPACALDSGCRVLAANAQFLRLHTLLDGPAFPLGLLELLPSLYGSELAGALDSLPAAGERREFPGSVATQFLDSQLLGFAGGCLLIHVDRAERRRLDEEHWQLIDSLAHSLRTPLASIRGYAETLQIAAADSNKREEYLESILRLSTSLNRTVSDLLYLSRLERGGFPDPLEPVDIARVVQELLESREDAALRAGVDLQLLLGEALPPVPANIPAVTEIVYNLLDNAIKYTPAGGRVAISLSRSGGSLELIVSDNGIGISTDEQPRIFERFFRASRVRSGAWQGAGLGLSKVHSVVSALGGSISLSSREGEGSSFCVLLPTI